MGTVRVERCPKCSAMVGEGTLYGHRCAPAAALVERAKQVGCERVDGTLNVHDASVTCDVCQPASPAIADRATAPAPLLNAWWMQDGAMYRTTIEDFLENTAPYQMLSSGEAWVICEARRIIAALRALPSRRETGEKNDER